MTARLIVCIGILVLANTARAGDSDEHAKLIGSWEAIGSGKEAGTIWTLVQADSKMSITQSHDGQKVLYVECSMGGAVCEVKESGKPTKVSMWFNGPKLVEMEVRGSDVLKRRFQASEDGATLQIEVIPVAPGGKADLLQLKRLTAAADRR